MEQQKSVKQRKHRGGDQHSQARESTSKTSSARTQKKTTMSWTRSILQGLLLSIVFFFLASYLITDTWLWGYRGKYTNLRHWFPVRKGARRLFFLCDCE